MNLDPDARARLSALEKVLDRFAGRYRERTGAETFGEYLAASQRTDDEEVLTEPVLAAILEEVLDFPEDAYFPQLSKLGSKPDFTPADLVAHRFVLDAKSSAIGDLDAHERQIRRYIDQRGLRYGVLFNMRELRVYPRGVRGHDPTLSFRLLPLWQLARGEAMATGEVERLLAFVERFSHRSLDFDARVTEIRRADPWPQREALGETPVIDVEYLVDRLRALSRLLAEDVADRQEALERQLLLDADLGPAIVEELRTLANDLEPGASIGDLPATVEAFRAGDGLAGRAWSQYRLRVSQLALIRIVLYRSWEDAGFVDERLYDGGFGQLYDDLGHELSRVLDEAFGAARERYPWLYGSAGTYDWYRPSDDRLVEVLYTLLPVPLGRLDTDVLGGLYESYVDEIDRDRLGQFYTPRAVVRFMLDRAGFTEDRGLFAIEGDRRRPLPMLDFATGSGGFLVEAARRLVESVLDGDPRSIDEGLAAVAGGLHGCEISPFPYYLTEVNLLLQVSRLLGRMRERGQALPRNLRLSVVHADTLATARGPDESLEGLTAEERADRALLEDRRFGLVPLDQAKTGAYDRMSRPDSFAFVVGNPPYVFESGNRALFDRLRRLPGWRARYRGKGDYLYYFMALAAERVAPGGRLAVIVPAGWMNAGAAGWLRELLARELRLDELFMFGSYRLFAPDHEDVRDARRAQSPTIESAILIATRAETSTDHQLRVTILEDDRAASRAIHGDERHRLDRHLLLDEMARRSDAGRGGRRGGIFMHSVRQDRLRHDEPWPVKFGERDLAARVVAHLDRQLASGDAEPLSVRWRIFQGVQTGADAYSARIQRRLSKEDRDALAAAGHRTGEPILELPPGRERHAPWRDSPALLARSVEPHAILYGALDEDNYTHLVWIGREDEVPEAIRDALEPWRRVLATRAEFVRNPRRWYETAWPRNKTALRQPKVIALYRTDRGRFAVDEDGSWQPSIKTTLCTAKDGDLSVAYLGGLLNSELLDIWYAVRGKRPRDVWRNYEPKPMARMPYRHVPSTAGRSNRVTAVADAATHHERVVALDALLASPASDAELAQALETTVRALASNRRALLPHRSVAPALTAIVKDPWWTQPPVVDIAALLAALPTSETVSVRLDPALSVTRHTDGPLGRLSRADDVVRFTRGRRVSAEVTGTPERLELLERLLEPSPRLLPDELDQVTLPKDARAFAQLTEVRLAQIEELLDQGRELVERAERLVCRLYAVPHEMEDEVVAHANDRAHRRSSTAAEAPADD